MDLLLLFKFSIPVRSKSSKIRGKEKRGYIDFIYEKVYSNRFLCLKIVAKVNCRVRFLEI